MPANGSAQLARTAAALRAAPNEIKLASVRGLKAAAKPLVADVKAAALAQLPSTGGLNRDIASKRVTVSVRTSARSAGIRLTTSAIETRFTDGGTVNHPVFGHGDRWVTGQSIPRAAGWWSKTLASKGAPVQAELMGAMVAIEAQIMGA